MATHKFISNSQVGYTRGSYKASFVHNAATAATGSTSFVMRYAGVVTGVYASVVETASSDRTDTITVAKRAQNAATSADTALLTTSGVLSSNNVSGTIARAVGTSGITAFTGSTNPVLSTTTATVTVAKGDTIVITNTHAGSNGSAGTQLNIVVEVEFEVGDGSAYSLAGN